MEFSKENQILITKEDGTEVLMEILFTYENPDSGKTYVLYFDESDSDEVMASRYDEEGHLFDLEGDEYEKISAVLDKFLEETSDDDDDEDEEDEEDEEDD